MNDRKITFTIRSQNMVLGVGVSISELDICKGQAQHLKADKHHLKAPVKIAENKKQNAIVQDREPEELPIPVEVTSARS